MQEHIFNRGKFIHHMEMDSNPYRTKRPEEALVFFLPFSVVIMVKYLYAPDSQDTKPIRRTVIYVGIISHKHFFWNRILGADHFMLSCHIRCDECECNTDLFFFFTRVGRVHGCHLSPSKDISFPEIHLQTGEINGIIGGLSPGRRFILAFFAGRLHGHIRYLLFQEWKERDREVQVYDQLPNSVSYNMMLKKSKFCLCPSGYEVASPRVVEVIYAECVPVLISDGYIPPFSDILNLKSFSVKLKVKDILNIKKILLGITEKKYQRLEESETGPEAFHGKWKPPPIRCFSHDSSLHLAKEIEYQSQRAASQ